MSRFKCTATIYRIEEADYDSILEKIGDVCKEYGAKFSPHLGEEYEVDAEDAEGNGGSA